MNQVSVKLIHTFNRGDLPKIIKDKNKGEHFKMLQVKKEHKISQDVIDDCLQDID